MAYCFTERSWACTCSRCYTSLRQSSSSWHSCQSRITRKTKHVDVDCHFVRDEIKVGHIIPKKVYSSYEVADILTKSVLYLFVSHMQGRIDVQVRGCVGAHLGLRLKNKL